MPRVDKDSNDGWDLAEAIFYPFLFLLLLTAATEDSICKHVRVEWSTRVGPKAVLLLLASPWVEQLLHHLRGRSFYTSPVWRFYLSSLSVGVLITDYLLSIHWLESVPLHLLTCLPN